MRPLALSLLGWMVAWSSLAQELRGLEELFSRGFLVDDRNGDGLADSVNAPFFGELEVEVELSEPHEILGIEREILSDPEIDAMNQRNYDRYDRYRGQFDQEDFKLPMVGGVLVSLRDRSGVLLLTNSENGLRLAREVVAGIYPGEHPVFRFRMLQPR